MTVKELSIKSPGREEAHLIVSAAADDGTVLIEKDPEKLLRLPAVAFAASAPPLSELCDEALATRQKELLGEIGKRSRDYFEEEVEKLESWAEDRISGLEEEIRDLEKSMKGKNAKPEAPETWRKKQPSRRKSNAWKACGTKSERKFTSRRTKSKRNATPLSPRWRQA